MGCKNNKKKKKRKVWNDNISKYHERRLMLNNKPILKPISKPKKTTTTFLKTLQSTPLYSKDIFKVYDNKRVFDINTIIKSNLKIMESLNLQFNTKFKTKQPV